MTAPLSAEDYAHIRADVHNAVLEAQQHDPPVTMEILFRLLDSVGADATGAHEEHCYDPRDCECRVGRAIDLLRDVQLRAVTKVPYEAREYGYELVLDADERGGR